MWTRFAIVSSLVVFAMNAQALEVGDRVAASCGFSNPVGKIKEIIQGRYIVAFDDVVGSICGATAYREAVSGNELWSDELFAIRPVNELTVSSYLGLLSRTYKVGQRVLVQCGYSDSPATISGLSSNGYALLTLDPDFYSSCGGWKSLKEVQN